MLLISAVTIAVLGVAFSAVPVGLALAGTLLAGSLIATAERRRLGLGEAAVLGGLHLAAFATLGF